MIRKTQNTHHSILRFAKSKGFLSPLWLMPNTDSDGVQRAFQELESFLQESYFQGELTGVTESDINSFVWKLNKTYAFKGWEGIAPYLLIPQTASSQTIADRIIE